LNGTILQAQRAGFKRLWQRLAGLQTEDLFCFASESNDPFLFVDDDNSGNQAIAQQVREAQPFLALFFFARLVR